VLVTRALLLLAGQQQQHSSSCLCPGRASPPPRPGQRNLIEQGESKGNGAVYCERVYPCSASVAQAVVPRSGVWGARGAPGIAGLGPRRATTRRCSDAGARARGHRLVEGRASGDRTSLGLYRSGARVRPRQVLGLGERQGGLCPVGGKHVQMRCSNYRRAQRAPQEKPSVPGRYDRAAGAHDVSLKTPGCPGWQKPCDARCGACLAPF
jgi:hypothetical protein